MVDMAAIQDTTFFYIWVMRKLNYFDLSLFVALLLTVAWVFYLDVKGEFYYTANDIIDVLLLLFSFLIVLGKSTKARYLVMVLLLLSLFNTITFSYSIDGTEYTSKSSFNIGNFGFNSFAFLLTVFYILIDWKYHIHSLKVLFHGSKEEQEHKGEKMINFYYEKFKNCSPEELTKIMNDFKLYPTEAQIALERINEEKNSSLI